jgi:hypothetical protein
MTNAPALGRSLSEKPGKRAALAEIASDNCTVVTTVPLLDASKEVQVAFSVRREKVLDGVPSAFAAAVMSNVSP